MPKSHFLVCWGVFQAGVLSFTFDVVESSTGMACTIRVSAAKMDSWGNCEQSEWNRIREEIRAQAEKEQQVKSPALPIGSAKYPMRSCEVIKQRNSSAHTGMHYLIDDMGAVFQTFCDMTIARGGWTLVASIHENNMTGRCTSGDRWSSEHGNDVTNYPNGDGFWENNETYGEVVSATNDDYKSPGYYSLIAKDIMIWHVPNRAPIHDIASRAFLKYHTVSGFLSSYGGNLASLYRSHFPIRKFENWRADNGPAIPISWDVGSNDTMRGLLGAKMRDEVDVGYVQFRTRNHEGMAFAICSGVKIKRQKDNVEHACIGSTSGLMDYCGDFAAFDYFGSESWRVKPNLTDAVMMIFYK